MVDHYLRDRMALNIKNDEAHRLAKELAAARGSTLLAEPEAEPMVRALSKDPRRLVGAPTLVDTSAVMVARKGAGGNVALDALLSRLDVEIVAMSAEAAATRAAHTPASGRAWVLPPS